MCEVSDIDTEIEEAEPITAKVIEYKSKIDRAINPTISHTGIVSYSPTTEMLNTDTLFPATNPTVTTRLPKLILPKFRGDVTTWTAFWDSYKLSVHDNRCLSTVDKFNYLKSLLEGPASHCIEGLPVTTSNYDDAIELLQKRFGRTQQVITAHMDELLKLPGCSSEKASSLCFIFDKIIVHIRGLTSLGEASDQYGSLLILIIMTKLPSDIRLRIARQNNEEVWKIEISLT